MTNLRVASIIVVSLALASPALAGTIVLTQGPYSYGSGGEFTATPDQPSSLSSSSYDLGLTATATSFQTFCIELTEEFTPGVTYNATPGPNAMGGGVGGGVGGDPVSEGTGWLYSEFATGNLADYNYQPGGRQASAGLLQSAIWMLEEEIAWDPNNNIFIQDVLAHFNVSGDSGRQTVQGGFAADYGVQALVLTDPNNPAGPVQDQLYFNNSSVGGQCVNCPSVPDGGMTMSLLGMAMAGLGLMARRLK
jgi:hypothetical protein